MPNVSAEEILESPVWREVWKRLYDAQAEQFLVSSPDQIDSLQGAAMRAWALREVQAELERMMSG